MPMVGCHIPSACFSPLTGNGDRLVAFEFGTVVCNIFFVLHHDSYGPRLDNAQKTVH